MLWFSKYCRRKIQRKYLRFLLKLQLAFAKMLSLHWFLRKTPFFCRKLAKIAENCDHNIDPWACPLMAPVFLCSRFLPKNLLVFFRQKFCAFLLTTLEFIDKNT
jgi:hypothetical protein